MIPVLKKWYYRYFSDPQAVVLIVLLLFSFAVLMTMGEMLMPVFVSIAIAYLLDGVAHNLEKFKVRHLIAVLFAYFLFIMLVLFLLLFLLPLLYQQLSELIQEIPAMVNKGRDMDSYFIHCGSIRRPRPGTRSRATPRGRCRQTAAGARTRGRGCGGASSPRRRAPPGRNP